MNPEVLLALLDSIVDPIVFMDDQHIIRYINPAAKDKYGERGNHDLVVNRYSNTTAKSLRRSFWIYSEVSETEKVNGL